MQFKKKRTHNEYAIFLTCLLLQHKTIYYILY